MEIIGFPPFPAAALGRSEIYAFLLALVAGMLLKDGLKRKV